MWNIRCKELLRSEVLFHILHSIFHILLLMIIGVLALQGNFAEHLTVLRSLGVRAIEVRNLSDLLCSDRLIIPGGESTVMEKLLKTSGMWEEIVHRGGKDLPIFGTCAGAILLSKNATGKHAPQTLQLMDITIDRNAYGTQAQSFDAAIDVQGVGRISAAFIRAPKITSVGSDSEIWASHEGSPVLVRQGRLLASTFHPEARSESAVHRRFLEL